MGTDTGQVKREIVASGIYNLVVKYGLGGDNLEEEECFCNKNIFLHFQFINPCCPRSTRIHIFHLLA